MAKSNKKILDFVIDQVNNNKATLLDIVGSGFSAQNISSMLNGAGNKVGDAIRGSLR